MTYDALLVARRGLGVDELRLASAAFAAAVRWALFAQTYGGDLGELRAAIETEPPRHLGGQELTEFMARRKALRAALAERERVLFPPDDADG